MRGVFVIGTDTGVGKTLLATLMLLGSQDEVVYWKPVQTGPAEDHDSACVERALGSARRVIDRGYRFELAASPHHAAARESARIELEPLLEIPARPVAADRRWVVEGAGGLMVPLSASLLLPDLIRALGLPVVLVASTRLGTINHTLLTLRQCASERLEVLGVVLMGAADDSARSGIASHAGAPILAEVGQLDTTDKHVLGAAARALMSQPVLREALCD